MGRGQIAIGISLAVAVVMLVGKWVAFVITDSTAIFSDAMESVVHIAATGIAAFSLWYAAQPADRDHLYGHGKIAYFSAGLEGGLILVASIAILYTGVRELVVGPDLKQLGLGLVMIGALAVMNLALGAYLVRVGKQLNSLVLVSNGKHVLTDWWTSAAVVAGVLAVELTGFERLDPIIGILAGAHIAWSGIGLLRSSFDGLMDRADPDTRRALIQILDEAVRAGLIGAYHQLRFRHADKELWITFHVLVPGESTVESSHARVTRLEDQIESAFPDEEVWVASHLEPLDHISAHPEGHDLPDPLEGPP